MAARASRDVELEAISKPTLESARAVLERKAKIYEKLKKGKSGGLNEAQFNSLLVDVSPIPALPQRSVLTDRLQHSSTQRDRPIISSRIAMTWTNR